MFITDADTSIRMQLREDMQQVVVLICPHSDGTVGNVKSAVRHLKALQKQAPARVTAKITASGRGDSKRGGRNSKSRPARS